MDTLSVGITPELSDTEVAEINAKAAFASDHLLHNPQAQLTSYTIIQRQRVASLVEGSNGIYWITEENRMRVAGHLKFQPEHSDLL